MRKLRICVVSNYYPPHFIGGYELGCRDVVEGLKTRGHEVRVLTSVHNVPRPEDDGEVYRWLRFTTRPLPHVPMFDLISREAANARALRRLCERFDPDVVHVWNPSGFSLSLVSVAQHQLRLPVCFFVSDKWLANWEPAGDPGYMMWEYRYPRLPRRVACRALLKFLDATGVLPAPRPPDFSRVQFPSQFIKRDALDKGKPVSGGRVIGLGLDFSRFTYRERLGDERRLLCVGQIVPHKGVHTAVEALRLLVHRHGRAATTLTLAGGSTLPDYEADIRRLVSSYGLESNVRFTGKLEREQLPALYREHEILIFPSIIDEALSLIPLEAMASGLAVVATATGGNPEALQHGVNALIFPKEDAETCAAHVLRLLDDARLLEEIRRNARLGVERKFRLEGIVDVMEQFLREVVAGADAEKNGHARPRKGVDRGRRAPRPPVAGASGQ